MRTRALLVVVALMVGGSLVGFKPQHHPTPYRFPPLKLFPSMPVDTGNPVTVEGADLGRYLFYDPILSRKKNLSCASCHKQRSAFSDGPEVFSKGGEGVLMARNTLPLFNLAWHKNFFWDGRAASIEQQIDQPVHTHDEMDMQWQEITARLNKSTSYRAKFIAAFGTDNIDSTLVAKAIGQFERTLISYRSKYDMVLIGKRAFTEEEYAGFNLVNDMTRGDCLHCHTTDSDPLGSTFEFSNNGLDAVAVASEYRDKGRGSITGHTYDNGKFKIPSLRNVALTGPYMHDGRFKTLEDVLDFYSEGVNVCANIDPKMEFARHKGAHFTPVEKHKILAFLRTLTDSAFISDPAFSDPFK